MTAAGGASRFLKSAFVRRCGNAIGLGLIVLWLPLAQAFTVTDIRLQGLQRVSAGTVFNIIPIQVGDTVDELTVRALIRQLFKSGYFKDIRMAEDDGVLIISVVERPAIESISIDGNKAIKTDALLDGLGQQGLREGEIFQQATLERVGLELERQYVAQGRYGASIETNVKELPRNRVDIEILVEEGKTSGIRPHQHRRRRGVLAGRAARRDGAQAPRIALVLPQRRQVFAGKAAGCDLEKLESYYKNQGYVEFDVEATHVSITPDRRQVYLTMQVEEGDKYTVDEVNVIGELNDVAPENLERLLLVEQGQVFNQARVTATEERMTAALGNAGYTFASANGIPQGQRRRHGRRRVLCRCR